MIYCGKWDDVPNTPKVSSHRATITPQLREYWGSSSTSLVTIPVIRQAPALLFILVFKSMIALLFGLLHVGFISYAFAKMGIAPHPSCLRRCSKFASFLRSCVPCNRICLQTRQKKDFLREHHEYGQKNSEEVQWAEGREREPTRLHSRVGPGPDVFVIDR